MTDARAILLCLLLPAVVGVVAHAQSADPKSDQLTPKTKGSVQIRFIVEDDQNTFSEWYNSKYNAADPTKRTRCQDCHMSPEPGVDAPRDVAPVAEIVRRAREGSVGHRGSSAVREAQASALILA